jgi:NAD(P)H-dependent FMN reductase
MQVLVFAASLRAGSLNRALARVAAGHLTSRGVTVDFAAFREFDAPLYDQDLLDASGFPAGVRRFTARLNAADGFAIASPEYTFSIPGPLKNLIDWSSQEQPIAWTGKPGLLLSASVSSVGGQRGLWALRTPLEALGAYVYPDMFSLPDADTKLNPAGQIIDDALNRRLAELTDAFARFADRLTR